MKKVFLSILTFFYLMVTSGVAMEVHYCLGKRAGVNFYHSDNDKCGRCGMNTKKNPCCNDEYKFYKLADAHKNVSSDHNFTISSPAIVPAYALYHLIVYSIVAVDHPSNNSPPERSAVPLYIRNCVFRL